MTDRWTREWTDKRRVRGAVLAGTEGASADEFEEQPWRLRLTVSPDDGGQPRGAVGAPAGRGGANVSTFNRLKEERERFHLKTRVEQTVCPLTRRNSAKRRKNIQKKHPAH